MSEVSGQALCLGRETGGAKKRPRAIGCSPQLAAPWAELTGSRSDCPVPSSMGPEVMLHGWVRLRARPSRGCSRALGLPRSLARLPSQTALDTAQQRCSLTQIWFLAQGALWPGVWGRQAHWLGRQAKQLPGPKRPLAWLHERAESQGHRPDLDSLPA